MIADVLLCPWEAIKLKIQLSRPGNEYPRNMFSAINKATSEEGFAKLYKGLPLLWLRQIPYTIIKFVAFEKTVQLFYDHIFTRGK